MRAFIVAPPALAAPRPARVRTAPSARRDEHEPSRSHMSLDPLLGFESFCRRAQRTFASDAAHADGLGTFAPPPLSLSHAQPPRQPPPSPPSPPSRLEMRGGRAFRAAVVDVWRSARAVTPRQRRVLTCVDERGAPQISKDSVGISLNLTPRDDALPALRADAHYFQIGGDRCLAWWFAATVDLSVRARASPSRFAALVAPFLQRWEQLKSRHRQQRGAQRRAFLDACLSAEHWQSPVQRLDRETAFHFITEVLDALLPTYLPLLELRPHDAALDDWRHVELGRSLDEHGAFGTETVETFCLSGGASCESTTLRANPLGSWRFSLAPSSFTAAGKVYNTLRTDGRSACPSLLYIDFV